MNTYQHYILDFDRTMFDTEAFYEATAGHANMFTPRIWDEFLADDFIYPDVAAFVARATGARFTIVSASADKYGSEAVAYQERKVRSSWLGTRADGVHIVPGLKGEMVASLVHPNETTVFIDDSILQLNDVSKQVPGVTCLQIVRPTAVVEISISSLHEVMYALGPQPS